MKFRGLDDEYYPANTANSRVYANTARPVSGLHGTAREILKQLFPTVNLLEEVGIKLYRHKNAFLDFYVPSFSLVIEVHGEQHYKFNTLFHKTAKDFAMQKRRDEELQEWCELNNLIYVELPYNESEEEWMNRIKNL